MKKLVLGIFMLVGVTSFAQTSEMVKEGTVTDSYVTSWTGESQAPGVANGRIKRIYHILDNNTGVVYVSLPTGVDLPVGANVVFEITRSGMDSGVRKSPGRIKVADVTLERG